MTRTCLPLLSCVVDSYTSVKAMLGNVQRYINSTTLSTTYNVMQVCNIVPESHRSDHNLHLLDGHFGEVGGDGERVRQRFSCNASNSLAQLKEVKEVKEVHLDVSGRGKDHGPDPPTQARETWRQGLGDGACRDRDC